MKMVLVFRELNQRHKASHGKDQHHGAVYSKDERDGTRRFERI